MESHPAAVSPRPLRPGGRLALVTTEHVAGGTVEFFARAQGCCERRDPATPAGLPLQSATDVTMFTCTTDQYVDVVLTYSGHPHPRRGMRCPWPGTGMYRRRAGTRTQKGTTQTDLEP